MRSLPLAARASSRRIRSTRASGSGRLSSLAIVVGILGIGCAASVASTRAAGLYACLDARLSTLPLLSRWQTHARRLVPPVDRPLRGAGLRPRDRLRSAGRTQVSGLYIACGIVARPARVPGGGADQGGGPVMELQFHHSGCCWPPFSPSCSLLAWPLARGWRRWSTAACRAGWRRGPAERALYRLAGVDASAGMGWSTYALALIAFNVLGVVAVYAPAAAAGRAAAESAGHGRGQRRLVVQHRHQLRHQHQLAGLRRRGDDELPDADAGADGAELRLGGHRHRRRGRPGPRLRGAIGGGTIGNFWVDLTRVTLYVLLPLSLVFGAVPRQPGGRSRTSRLQGSHHARDHTPTSSPRSSADGQP